MKLSRKEEEECIAKKHHQKWMLNENIGLSKREAKKKFAKIYGRRELQTKIQKIDKWPEEEKKKQ